MRSAINSYSQELYDTSYKEVQNSIRSLIVDGTRPWGTSFYEFALFIPRKIKHIKLTRMDNLDATFMSKKILNVISYWYMT